MIGTIIIVILLILGGLYVLANRRAENPDLNQNMPGAGENGGMMGNSNEATDANAARVEAEMEAELAAMEAEMTAMEAELR